MGDLAPGSLVAARYRVERTIGSGGMGLVVAATHVDLGSLVAIKVLTVDPRTSPDAVGRFLREARAAARLRSEFVARVSDFGTLDDGRPFMVLEHLEGDDLGVLLGRGLDITELVDAICQACAGLAEAHSAGIIHRDLKPSNLFRTRRPDGSHCTKVLDFGISKLTGGAADAMLVSTKTSAVLGTPLYMSPEQVRSTRDVDARTDVWSLGVVLAEALGGFPPFRGDTMGAVFSRILETDPELHLVKGAPEGLAGVVRRCLQKRPGDRFADVAELASALAPFGSTEGRDAAKRARDTRVSPPPRASSTSIPGIIDDPSSAETLAADLGADRAAASMPLTEPGRLTPERLEAAARSVDQRTVGDSGASPAGARTVGAVVSSGGPRTGKGPGKRWVLVAVILCGAGAILTVTLARTNGDDPPSAAPALRNEARATSPSPSAMLEPPPEPPARGLASAVVTPSAIAPEPSVASAAPAPSTPLRSARPASSTTPPTSPAPRASTTPARPTLD